MQDKIRVLVSDIEDLLRVLPRDSHLYGKLDVIRVRLDDLRFEFPDMQDCKLTLTSVDLPDDLLEFRTVLPQWFVDLVVSGRQLPVSERTGHQNAAISLLPVCANEVLEPIVAELPRIGGNHVSLRVVVAGE
ncbi:hypothetical protein GII36_03705 [Candidatus Mycosynbacter amalyticus]|uniref:Uncharacterized protein n=1 Tax=Candidatus Mycosynbacter amalyticus TaxID=2665156 RepID=A0A857MK37_9BACT|nr:hypothetical protein [Candidatus Mycosynbacter amalyticus]QHN42944.1 hypothetical protein GII36_03705 [Candidatus Mycosynbacter amalyticus]